MKIDLDKVIDSEGVTRYSVYIDSGLQGVYLTESKAREAYERIVQKARKQEIGRITLDSITI